MMLKGIKKVEKKEPKVMYSGEYMAMYFKRMENTFKEIFNSVRTVEEPMDLDHAAKFLKMAPGTLQNKLNEGYIPFHRTVDGRIYFYRSELNEQYIRKYDIPEDESISELANNILNR